MHQNDFADAATLESMVGTSGTGARLYVSMLDAESAAWRYLNAAMRAPKLDNFEAVDLSGAKPEFKCLGVEQIPFTKLKLSSFASSTEKFPYMVRSSWSNSMTKINWSR